MPTTAAPGFLYFDLGNVLLNFDHRRAARQMADVAGIESSTVWDNVFGNELEWRYERGEITTAEFGSLFAEATCSQFRLPDLMRAASDIFEVNIGVWPIVAQLRRVGHRLGILSNTNEAHWSFVADGRYRILPGYFEFCVLSYEVRSMKPDGPIYEAAINKTGLPAEQIFFVDDRPENVAAARDAGMDAVLYRDPRQLADDLRDRGVEFNL